MKNNSKVYEQCMREIKLRMSILEGFMEKKTTGHVVTDEEFCFLQLRKIIELVMLSSIAPNHDAYKTMRANMEGDYRSDWNARFILKDLSKVNPDFYPRPVIQSQTGENKFHYENKENGFLDEKELLKAYEKCGGMLHARNPFSEKKTNSTGQTFIKNTFESIWSLLEIHFVRMIDDSKVWLIHMMDPKSTEVYIATAEKQ